MPHFTADDVTGAPVAYRRLWQRKHLVLVRLADPAGSEASLFARGLAPLGDDDVAVVITHDPIDGIPAAGVIVADRWGEIAFATHARRDADLPEPDAIAEWIRYVEVKCPECEGEAH